MCDAGLISVKEERRRNTEEEKNQNSCAVLKKKKNLRKADREPQIKACPLDESRSGRSGLAPVPPSSVTGEEPPRVNMNLTWMLQCIPELQQLEAL